MEILSNPWVVGIGGGVLSGAFVTFVSRYVLGRRENREYLQKVVTANRELVYAIRPGVSEGVVPLGEVVVALIHSTARKHGVTKEDLYSPAEIGEELVKEVMDSSFLSAAKKHEHCTLLDPLMKPAAVVPETGAVAPQPSGASELKAQTLSEYRQRLTRMMSMMMGGVTALMTLVVVLLSVGDSIIPMGLEMLLPMIAALGMLLLSMMTFMLVRWRSDRRPDKEEDDREKRQPTEVERWKPKAL